jgi:cytochrome c-type biogenesis protein CcmH/NrfG
MLGHVYLQLKQYSKAEDALETAIRIDASYATAWNNLVEVYRGLGQGDKALAAAREAVRLRPDDPVNVYGLGAVYAERGDRERVNEVYQRLRVLSPAKADEFFRRHIRP